MSYLDRVNLEPEEKLKALKLDFRNDLETTNPMACLIL